MIELKTEGELHCLTEDELRCAIDEASSELRVGFDKGRAGYELSSYLDRLYNHLRSKIRSDGRETLEKGYDVQIREYLGVDPNEFFRKFDIVCYIVCYSELCGELSELATEELKTEERVIIKGSFFEKRKVEEELSSVISTTAKMDYMRGRLLTLLEDYRARDFLYQFNVICDLTINEEDSWPLKVMVFYKLRKTWDHRVFQIKETR